MRSEKVVHLVRTSDNSLVAAKLIMGVTRQEIDEAVRCWALFLSHNGNERSPEHAHWRWDVKAQAVAGMVPYIFCGIVSESMIQALMLVEDCFSQAKLPEQAGKPIVYVSFLSTAPWNDRGLTTSPLYRGCGTHLVCQAVDHSQSVGYKGRIGLHSLPQSEVFYQHVCQMTDMGVDPNPEHEGLRYFEFAEGSAREFLYRSQS